VSKHKQGGPREASAFENPMYALNGPASPAYETSTGGGGGEVSGYMDVNNNAGAQAASGYMDVGGAQFQDEEDLGGEEV
jgi:hypothetical protein